MTAAGSVLVTGGAGYVGSHTVLALLESGRKVVVIDDLSTGRRDLAPPECVFIEASAGDRDRVERAVKTHKVSTILHIAGSSVVPDSIRNPAATYHNNTANSLALLDVAARLGVPRFIFSSTAAVYAPNGQVAVSETDATGPLTPYGRSKLMTEQIMADIGEASGLSWLALRYFNVAGADPQGRAGPTNPKAEHLIRMVCQAALGVRPAISVYGADYETDDGTCVRDFIHVSDLAAAHLAAVSYLESGGPSRVLNCGYGRPVSVREVIAAAERVIGRRIAQKDLPRRPGDAPFMVADNRAIQETFAWQPRFADLDAIVASALQWERAQGLSQPALSTANSG